MFLIRSKFITWCDLQIVNTESSCAVNSEAVNFDIHTCQMYLGFSKYLESEEVWLRKVSGESENSEIILFGPKNGESSTPGQHLASMHDIAILESENGIHIIIKRDVKLLFCLYGKDNVCLKTVDDAYELVDNS